MTAPYPVTGMILAGGHSRRMGRPKAILDVGGMTLLDMVLAPVRELCQDVLVVAAETTDYLDIPHRIVRDLLPDQGPLGGLATGLFFARQSWVLALSCDLPFLSPALLGLLIKTALAAPPGSRAVVPRTTEGWQPLVALYSRSCLAPARLLLKQGERKISRLKEKGVFWQEVDEEILRALDPNLTFFTNVNTPADLEAVRDHLKGVRTEVKP